MKKHLFVFLCTLALLVPTVGHADVVFTFAPNPLHIFTQPGGIFEIAANVSNTNSPGTASFDVADYAFTVSPSLLVLPDDFSDDRTNFDAFFQRTYAPGDSISQPFLDFTVGLNAPLGDYSVNIELRDDNGDPLTNQSFDLSIQGPTVTPEPNPAFLLCIGCIASIVQVRQIKKRKRHIAAP